MVGRQFSPPPLLLKRRSFMCQNCEKMVKVIKNGKCCLCRLEAWQALISRFWDNGVVTFEKVTPRVVTFDVGK